MKNHLFLNDSPFLSGCRAEKCFGLSSGAGLSASGIGMNTPASSAHSLRLMERFISRGNILMAGGRRYAAAALATAIGFAAVPDAHALDITNGQTSTGLHIYGGNANNPIHVSSGGVTSDTHISSGGSQYVSSGGSAISTDISQGGWQYVNYGGSAIGTNISNGGRQYVYSGGSAISTNISNGGQQYLSNGSASSTNIEGGRQYVYSGGSAINTNISQGGTQDVNSGGSVISTNISSGGQQYISNGGSAISTNISLGGRQYVNSGGSAIRTNISSGGQQYISNGGSAISTDISQGGWQDVNYGGSAINTIISQGGSQYVNSGGSAISTNISNGGQQYVSNGGSAVNTNISQAGTQNVNSGGSAINTNISQGGTQNVNSGGSAINTNISQDGTQYIDSGGSAVSTNIEGGRQEVNYGGSAISTTISDGGLQNVFTGGTASATAVHRGGLLFADSGASVVNIGSPVLGTLGGYGIISGDVTIASGGTLAAGCAFDSTATPDYGGMTISGDLSVVSGGAYQVRVDYTGSGGLTAADSASVTGSATFASGASVRHVATGGTGVIDLASQYTVLTASGGVTGTVSDITASSNLRFLRPILEISGDDLLMSFERAFIFADFDYTPNQNAVANALDSLRLDNPDSLALFIVSNVTDADDVNALYNQLSGEMHASLAAGLMLLDRDFSRWILDRSGRNSLARTIRASSAPAFAGATGYASIHPRALESRFQNNVWADLGYARQGVDGDGNAGRYTFKGPEISLGYDHIAPSGWLGGVAFRYGDRKMKVASRLSESDVDSYSLAAYGGFQTAFGPGAARLVLGGAYTRHEIDGTRHVNIGAIRQTLRSDYHANSYQLYMEGAYAFPLGRIWLEPFADLALTSTHVPGFSETGGNAALRAHSQSQNNLSQLLGLRLILPAFCRINVEAQAGWRNTYGKLDKAGSFSFAEGGSRFGIKGSKLSRDEAVLDLRAQYRVCDNLRLGLEANAAVGERSTSLRGGVFVAVEW